MPIYEYECGACGETHEFIQKFSEGPKRKCPSCGKQRLRKLMSAAAFHLKGTGWYVTDFRDGGKKKGDDASSSASGSSASSDSSSASDNASDNAGDSGDSKSSKKADKSSEKKTAKKSKAAKDSGSKPSSASA
jgi:putative FmdB family regulatory protein